MWSIILNNSVPVYWGHLYCNQLFIKAKGVWPKGDRNRQVPLYIHLCYCCLSRPSVPLRHWDCNGMYLRTNIHVLTLLFHMLIHSKVFLLEYVPVGSLFYCQNLMGLSQNRRCTVVGLVSWLFIVHLHWIAGLMFVSVLINLCIADWSGSPVHLLRHFLFYVPLGFLCWLYKHVLFILLCTLPWEVDCKLFKRVAEPCIVHTAQPACRCMLFKIQGVQRCVPRKELIIFLVLWAG